MKGNNGQLPRKPGKVNTCLFTHYCCNRNEHSLRKGKFLKKSQYL